MESLAAGAVGTAGPSNVAHATTSIPNPPFASLTSMYGLTNGGLVYSINTTTGAVSQIGALSFGTAAAGRDPYSSNFYYVSAGSTIDISYWNPNDNSNTVAATNVSVTGRRRRSPRWHLSSSQQCGGFVRL